MIGTAGVVFEICEVFLTLVTASSI